MYGCYNSRSFPDLWLTLPHRLTHFVGIVVNRLLPIISLLLCHTLVTAVRGEDDSGVTRFFELSIRPLLQEHCVECHGPEKQESGLRLDRREDALRGGSSGLAIVPGAPEKSLLIKAVSGEGDFQMPPEEKLKLKQIEALSRWIKSGANWPKSSAPSPDDRRSHWAFLPLRRALPQTGSTEAAGRLRHGASNSIDLFILSRLADAELEPAEPASKGVLLRRLSIGLTGVPPTPSERQHFLADNRPDAYGRAVDRLLASPRYGERWGRYWLDVARYADNKGYVFFEEKNFPWAWAYRDYVVRAFNEDLPFDRFIVEQLAADQLDLQHDRRPLAAMGYLTTGARFTNNSHDVIDDRIDVVTRGLMGLTVTCARCHDHKFDPIPQADYYSLYGVFRSSVEPTLGPLFESEPTTEAYRQFASGMAEREKKLDDFVDRQREQIMTSARDRVEEYLMAVHAKRNHPSTENFMLLTNKGDLVPAMIHRWETYLKRAERRDDPFWNPWHRFAAISDEQFSTAAADVLTEILGDASTAIQPLLLARLDGNKLATMADVARVYAEVLKDVDQKWATELEQAKTEGREPATQLADKDSESIRLALYGPSSPAVIPRTLSWGFLDLLPDRPTQGEFKALIKEVEQFSTKQPSAPPRAMVLQDIEPIYEPVIFQRGNPNRKGRPVPRRFLEAVSQELPQPFQHGSGRLELAQQIASPQNPLTARVFVNRVWRHHFGRGLVDTPSDFGRQGERPSHPELLDWLALQFIESGWSTKELHRLILKSSTYCQSSTPSAPWQAVIAQRDPENKLLSHFRRRRLDFESMRDSMLSVSGQLDRTIGGPPQDLLDLSQPRRSVYGFIDRMDLPNLLRSFDFPDPAATSPKRDETTVPTQGLFFMNHALVNHCAKSMASIPELSAIQDPGDRAVAAFRLILARDPDEQEMQLAQSFVSGATDAKTKSSWRYGFGRVDEESQRVADFREMTYWTGSRWQVGSQLPDPKLGWVFVDRKGGHPAATYDRCVIRRWTSPISGKIRLHGLLKHVPAEGNGVRGRLVSSRVGVLGEWKAHHSEATTSIETVEIQAGDTIDMVVDFQDQITHDEHLWHLVIDANDGQQWDSRGDFRGQQADRWQMYIQALLMTNEFVYID